MSKNWKQEPELQLIEASQDGMSISQRHRNKPYIKLWVSSPTHSTDDWSDSWGENIGGDEFVDLDDLVDTDLDSDIIDFGIDEY